MPHIPIDIGYTPTPPNRKIGQFYVINLYTWIADRDAAADLAHAISDSVGSLAGVDKFATTIGLFNSDAEPERVFVDIIVPPNERARHRAAAQPVEFLPFT